MIHNEWRLHFGAHPPIWMIHLNSDRKGLKVLIPKKSFKNEHEFISLFAFESLYNFESHYFYVNMRDMLNITEFNQSQSSISPRQLGCLNTAGHLHNCLTPIDDVLTILISFHQNERLNILLNSKENIKHNIFYLSSSILSSISYLT